MTTATDMIADMAANSEDAAAFLRSLASGPRLLVLCHLSVVGELSAGALAERIGLSQSALSQHLAKLREQGLIAYRREAQTLIYRIADERAAKLLEVLHQMFCPELER